MVLAVIMRNTEKYCVLSGNKGNVTGFNSVMLAVWECHSVI